MARRKSKKLTDDEINSTVGRLLQDAENFAEEQLDTDRAQLTNYYMGRPFGNEEPGRSKIVLPEVRNVVQAILPSLLRIFMGPEKVVEYKPREAEDVDGSKQATDYVNYIVMDDNDGFSILHSVFKDGLVRRLGIVKWWWEEEERSYGTTLSGLSEDQLLLLQEDNDVEMGELEMDPNTGRYDVEVEYVRAGIAKLAAVPPEEFLFNRNARDRDEAAIVAHKRTMPLADAIRLLDGVATPEEIEEAARVTNEDVDDSELTQARRFDEGYSHTEEGEDRVLICESYPYLDLKGDGSLMLYRVWTAGDTFQVLGKPEAVSHRPFALFAPDPEPHTLIGLCPADNVADIQEIKSAVMRRTLDSLNLAIHQRTEIVEGAVNLDDALNTEMGGLVRVRAPGMMREVRHSFIGGDALSVMQYLDEEKQNRTGISKAAAGLDADALQSSTKAAVAATLTAAQQHIELIARVFAETGLKQMFKGLLMLICENQNKERIVRLRNEFVPMDPRSWDSGMDVRVNLALGAGTTEEKVAVLNGILGKQEQVFGMLGPSNPLVKLSQYRNTLGRTVELAGFPDAAEFFQEIDPAQEKQMEEAAAQGGGEAEQPDPQAAAYVQAEQMKVQQKQEEAQINAQLKMQELELQRREMDMKDDRERDKAATDATIQLRKLELEHDAKLELARLNADAARLREGALGGE